MVELHYIINEKMQMLYKMHKSFTENGNKKVILYSCALQKESVLWTMK